MKNDIDNVKLRAFQYWYVDGISEAGFGLLCLFLGAFLWIQARVPQGSWLNPVLVIFFVLLVFGSGYLLRTATTAIKNRLTYPRTGYVAYSHPKNRYTWLAALLGIGISLLFVAILNHLPGSTAWLPAISGIVFAIALLVTGLRLGLVRFYVIGFWSLVLGGILSLSGNGDVIGLSIFDAGVGLALIFSGIWVLRRYLRNTSRPEERPNA